MCERGDEQILPAFRFPNCGFRTTQFSDIVLNLCNAISPPLLVAIQYPMRGYDQFTSISTTLDDLDAWRRDEAGEAASVQADVLRRTADLVDALRTSPADVILVTNEVGWGVVPATAAGRLFRDLMGRVNAEVARACDETILVVAGRRVPLEALARPSVHDDAGEG